MHEAVFVCKHPSRRLPRVQRVCACSGAACAHAHSNTGRTPAYMASSTSRAGATTADRPKGSKPLPELEPPICRAQHIVHAQEALGDAWLVRTGAGAGVARQHAAHCARTKERWVMHG